MLIADDVSLFFTPVSSFFFFSPCILVMQYIHSFFHHIMQLHDIVIGHLELFTIVHVEAPLYAFKSASRKAMHRMKSY